MEAASHLTWAREGKRNKVRKADTIHIPTTMTNPRIREIMDCLYVKMKIPFQSNTRRRVENQTLPGRSLWVHGKRCRLPVAMGKGTNTKSLDCFRKAYFSVSARHIQVKTATQPNAKAFSTECIPLRNRFKLHPKLGMACREGTYSYHHFGRCRPIPVITILTKSHAKGEADGKRHRSKNQQHPNKQTGRVSLPKPTGTS